MKNTRTKTVCLIGAGNIGSCHLQGLATIKTPLDISVVDSSLQSLNICREHLTELSRRTSHTIHYSTRLASVPKKLDVAIIAVRADSRARVIKQLLKHVHVRYLILEKILFQKKRDYQTIGILLKKTRTKAWVNCPLRIMPYHASLKEKIGNDPVLYEVRSGSRHGLMTNAIHYADYLAYLAGSTKFSVFTSLLSPRLLSSKRPGSFELTGTLLLRFDNGNTGILSQNSAKQISRTTTITTRRFKTTLDEANNRAVIQTGEKSPVKKVPAPFLLQSNMTGYIVGEILKRGTCALTPYEESALIHLNLLEPIRLFLQRTRRHSPVDYPFT